MNFRFVPCCCLLLLLVGCGSSPRVDFYALQPVDGTSAPIPTGAEVLGLGPLSVPDYLRRPQLVTRGPGNELRINDFHRWAEPVENALPRIVATNVDQLSDGLVVVGFPWDSRIQADYRLLGRVNQFIADAQGLAVLEVQWGVQSADGEPQIQPRRSRYKVQAEPADSPAAIVAAMNETLALFSQEIAREIEAAQAASPAP